MADPNHPIWAVIRLVAMLAAMVAILWTNASQFDHTEAKAIVELFLTAIGIEAGVKVFKAIGKPKEG